MASIVSLDPLWNSIEKVARQDSYPNSNLLLLFVLVDTLDIAHGGSRAREHFTLFLQNGSPWMKIRCLSRLKCVFKEERKKREFVEWAIPLLVSQISYASKVTEMITDILYQNTKISLNLGVVIKALKEMPQAVSVLTRLDSARNFIYRIITTKDGFALFENCANYVTKEFKSFMVVLNVIGHCLAGLYI